MEVKVGERAKDVYIIKRTNLEPRALDNSVNRSVELPLNRCPFGFVWFPRQTAILDGTVLRSSVFLPYSSRSLLHAKIMGFYYGIIDIRSSGPCTCYTTRQTCFVVGQDDAFGGIT